MSEIEIEGEITIATSEEAAYAQVLDRLSELDETISALDENAILTNNDFDDTWGFWSQVQNGHRIKVGDNWINDLGDKRADSIIVHKRNLTENYLNLDVSPAIVTQTKVSYNPTSTDGENFTRMSNGYHELIVEGKAIVPHDSQSPNFTAFGASAYNKAWGGIGATAITGRVQDLYYDGTENIIPTGYTTNVGANKTCGGFFAARRNAPYSQGKAGTSYSIALEAQMINAPGGASADGTDEYYGNADSSLGLWPTWTNAFHEVVGGRRPVSAAIMINGFSSAQKTTSQSTGIAEGTEFTLRNGTYNGIIIGASCMQIRGGVPTEQDENGTVTATTNGNSHETVGINTANWSVARHGFYLLKHGYSGRILKAKSAALFETLGAKFFNADGSMPFAISCIDTYTYTDDNEETQTVHGTPYLDFKLGSASDFVQNNIPLERPTDTTKSRIGYQSTTNSMNLSSTGSIKFNVLRDFTSAESSGKVFTMSSTDFSTGSSEINLGSMNKRWNTLFSKMGTVNSSDNSEIKTSSITIVENGEETDEKTKILTAWGSLKYKMFEFKGNSEIKHFGLVAQDIISAFAAQELNATDYGLVETYTSGNTTTYGVRYNECLALECAYIRSQLTGA